MCDFTFSWRGNLNMHIAAIHENKKPHKCSMWDSSFSQKKSLDMHTASIHGDAKPY